MVYANTVDQSRAEKDVRSIAFVLIGSFLMACNINSFVHSGNLFPGGFTGLTVLIQRICKTYFDFNISYTLVNIGLNAIPAYIGYKTIGKHFTFFSLMMVFLTGIFSDFLPYFEITSDRLLVAFFGGMINGTAITLALKGRASSGGTDFIAVWLSQKFNASNWNVVLGINAVMLTIAGLLFGFDAALYSIIFQFVSTQVINTLHQAYSRSALTIITDKPDEMEKALLAFTHHGITRFEGQGAYSNTPRTMLYTVVGRDEVKEVVRFVKKYDPNVFINVTKSEMIVGRFYKDSLD